MADLIGGGIIPVTGGVPLNNIVVYTTESRWVPADKGLPEKSGTYLCTKRGRVCIHQYSANLYNVDKHDFRHMKKVSGFYDYDSEWGYYKVDGVTAWMPLPEPYRGGD